MKATGTKGYLSDSVKKTIRGAKGDKLLKGNTKVSRQQATKIIKALKDEGLAHKTNTTATKYVNRSFKREENRQEMIKKQNIGDRAKESAEEKAAQEAKTGKNDNKKATAGGGGAMQQSHTALPTSSNSSPDGFVGSSFGTTNIKPADELPKPITKPPEWEKEEEDLIDMAID